MYLEGYTLKWCYLLPLKGHIGSVEVRRLSVRQAPMGRPWAHCWAHQAGEQSQERGIQAAVAGQETAKGSLVEDTEEYPQEPCEEYPQEPR